MPLIAKLTPEGTLDGSFSQQGVLEGTLLDIPGGAGSADPVLSAIDPQGRIVVFGTNGGSAFGDPPLDYVLSRLNPDGTIDSTFGDGGNVFLTGSLFPNSDAPGPTGVVTGLEILSLIHI